jgi:hypothetical protein
MFHLEGNLNRSRDELAAIVLEDLSFEDQCAFDRWFATFNGLARAVIRKLAFYKACPVTLLERETGMSILFTEKQRYSTVVRLNPDLNLKFLGFETIHDVFVASMPTVLQIAFRPFLEPPEHKDINGGVPAETVVFNNSDNFGGIFALFYEALLAKKRIRQESVFPNPFKFTKKETAALYQESGFPRFPDRDFPLPESLQLAAAFILCQEKIVVYGSSPPEPEADNGMIRGMVERFFSPRDFRGLSYLCYEGSFFEGLLTGAYLKKRGASGFEYTAEIPALRQVFFDFLKSVEHRDSPVPMDEMFSFILKQGVFLFSCLDPSHHFRFKADSLTVDGVAYRSYEHEIVPVGSLVFELITKPLARAYCFLFCALGCLELTVAKPAASAVLNGKEIPLSLYDGVRAFRLTGFGRWCLGFTDEKPAEDPQNFEIRADAALMYVTLRGESLERRVFLDKIGTKIGAERWTVNAASFLNGCTGKKAAAERVKKFHALVDSHPAEHWEAFFTQIVKNADAVKERTEDFLVYEMPLDRAARDMLMNDAEFRRVARFAEDHLVLVRKGNRQKFLSALTARGIGTR